MAARILIVDDEPAITHALRTLLSRQGYDVVSTDDVQEATDLIADEEFNLLISDIHMEPINGIELLRIALKRNPKMAVVMITGYGSVDSALQALKLGAYDYVTKPFRFDELFKTVKNALEYERAQHSEEVVQENEKPRYYYRQLVGDSSAMRHIYQFVDTVAGNVQPVLIIGEPGTGKTLLAWVLHCRSGRYKAPYVQVSCAGPLSTFQTQVIQADVIQKSHTGSLLLEDIHELDLAKQKILLRYLNARQFVTNEYGERVPRDTRLLLTATRDIQQMVQHGEFLEELYYQLAAVPVDLPPLRERLQDLPLLVQHFFNVFEQRDQVNATISSLALKALEGHTWPGNVKELHDVLFLAARNAKDKPISLEVLPKSFRENVPVEATASDQVERKRWASLREFLKRKQHDFAEHLLSMTDGDKEQVARIMGMSVEELENVEKWP